MDSSRSERNDTDRDTRSNSTARRGRRRSIGRAAITRLAVALVLTSLFVSTVAGPAMAAGSSSAPLDTANETVAEQNSPDDLEAVVDEAVAEQLNEHGVPGATVAVVEGDDVALAKGYGEADADTGTPVDASETAFEIGSVTKLVTWTAVMQAVEDGKLDLDEDVNAYLEDSAVEVPDAYDEPVTLRHLATHTAGFEASANPGIVADPDEVSSLEAALTEDPPDRVRPPGETVSYSNYGAALAGHVVAEAYDTTFDEYVESEIFDPLGMDHSTTGLPAPDDQPAVQATPHEMAGGAPTPVDRTYINWRPAGATSATATDMAAFMSAHLGDGAVGDARILEPGTVGTMHAVHHERHPAVNGWRFGFYEYGDGDLIAHDGATTHFTSLLVLAPEADVGVFVSYNVRGAEGSPAEVVDAVLEAYDLGPESSDPVPSSASGVAERAGEVSGEYTAAMAPGSGPAKVSELLLRATVDATDDGELALETIDGQSVRFVETEPYVYHEVDGDDVMAFDVEDGEVTAMYLSSMPPTDWVPVPPWQQLIPVGASLGAALLGFALSILGWVGLAAVRRWRRFRSDGEGVSTSRNGATRGTFTVGGGRFGEPSRLARGAAVALCVVSLAFVALFAIGLSAGGPAPFALPPLSLRVAFVLPYLVVVLAAATAVGSVLAWREGYWSRRTRIHQTVLAVLGLLLVAQLFQFGLLGG